VHSANFVIIITRSDRDSQTPVENGAATMESQFTPSHNGKESGMIKKPQMNPEHQ